MDMQPYADYSYYSDNYFGNRIIKEEFPRYARWASALIDRITSGRVRRLKEIPICVKDAMCVVAEICYLQKQKDGRAKKSENNDGYSVSYADVETEDNMLRKAAADIRTYLAGTSLLYRGRLSHDHECRAYDSESET